MLTYIWRTVVMYIAILAGVRVMGKRQISQLQTSELVVTLLISELAVMPIQQHREPIWNGLAPMVVLIVCELAVSELMMKSGRFRELVCGKPVKVIENGVILREELRRLRMSEADVYEQLRLNGVFELSEVKLAVIETNGVMSVSLRDKESAPQGGGRSVKKL